MITSLLLQSQAVHTAATVTSSSIGIYLALAGTLIASLVAAITSLRASSKSSATAREVAELSNRTAQDLKDKEFRNDYYKKIIDRRLIAYELLEKVVLFLSKRSIITLNTSVGIGTHEVYAFFAFEEDYLKFHRMTIELLEKTFRYSNELKGEIKTLQNMVANIGNSFMVHVGEEIGNDNLRLAGVKHDAEFKLIRKKFISLIRREITEIQDINKFFAGLQEPLAD